MEANKRKKRTKRKGEKRWRRRRPPCHKYIYLIFSVSHDGVFFLVNQQNTVNGIRTSGLLHALARAAAFKPSDLNRSARLIEPLSLHARHLSGFSVSWLKSRRKSRSSTEPMLFKPFRVSTTRHLWKHVCKLGVWKETWTCDLEFSCWNIFLLLF